MEEIENTSPSIEKRLIDLRVRNTSELETRLERFKGEGWIIDFKLSGYTWGKRKTFHVSMHRDIHPNECECGKCPKLPKGKGVKTK